MDMGTQFSSRLSAGDRQRILEGLHRAVHKALPSKPKAAAKRLGVTGLPTRQARGISDSIVGVILEVASQKGLFQELPESDSFENVLRELLKMRGDAEFNGFSGIIRSYRLEQSSNAIAELSLRLSEAAGSAAQPDLFKVSAKYAGRLVLAEAMSDPRPVTNGSQAVVIGKKLAALTVNSLVSRYIKAFIKSFLTSLVARSNPNRSDAVANAAPDLTDQAVRRVVQRAVNRVTKEGRLSNAGKIREIVVEELRRFLAEVAPRSAS